MSQALILKHQTALKQCRLCPNMVPPPIMGGPVKSKILLIGQAPGDKEPELGRPFAWTAGKTLFKWFSSIGMGEEAFREKVYIYRRCVDVSLEKTRKAEIAYLIKKKLRLVPNG